MLNNQQIKLVQTAVRAAGIRTKEFDGRYRMLLSQYKQPNGRPVTSCKQLNNSQLEDLLAICESHGWQCPGKKADHFRSKVQNTDCYASYAQQSAIKHLAGDLGWNDRQLAGMLERLTNGKTNSLVCLAPQNAYAVIEALKAIIGRRNGKAYKDLTEIKQDYMEVPKDGQASKIG